MYKKEYQDGGRMQAPQGMEQGVAQLKAMKQAYDQAVENKDMETIGKIEALVMEMFEATDDPRVKEALSMMFPTMDALMERPQEEAPREQMMAAGGKLKMVKNDDGEMVPFYAADGVGKMAYGGKMEMPGGGMMEMKKMMMAYGGTMGKKKKKMTYPGGGYFMMK